MNEKGKLLERDLEHVYGMVNDRLKCLTGELPADNSLKAVEMYDLGMCDPVRIFVKKEPHNVEKMANHRYRLVSSVSIVDEIIERLLCSTQNNAEINSWETCPSKPGFGLSSDLQTQKLFNQVAPHMGENLYKSDVSGWDWNYHAWLYDLDRRIRELCASGDGFELWSKLLRARFEALKWTMFVTSDGEVFIQTKPGIMLSGSYLTSSTNSRSRVGAAFTCGADWAIAMGDDCVEENQSLTQGQLVAAYKECGFRIKDVGVCVDEFEFCSHTFRNGIAIPQNFWKGTFRLLSKEPDVMELLQFVQEYRHVPEQLEVVLNFLMTLPSWCGVIDGI